jgi:hypothetical protein
MSENGSLDETVLQVSADISPTTSEAVDVDVTFTFIVHEQQDDKEVEESATTDTLALPASSFQRCGDTFLAGIYSYRVTPELTRFKVIVPAEVGLHSH